MNRDSSMPTAHQDPFGCRLAHMLSTRFGYGRPAPSARCFAAAFWASVSGVAARLDVGLGRFHGGGVKSVMARSCSLVVKRAVSGAYRELAVDAAGVRGCVAAPTASTRVKARHCSEALRHVSMCSRVPGMMSGMQQHVASRPSIEMRARARRAMRGRPAHLLSSWSPGCAGAAPATPHMRTPTVRRARLLHRHSRWMSSPSQR